ncbi:MAG: hypothetical protein MJE77_26640 [Proteobacteria bacterium]|nr:hypothetical protein [Pseudomonadota bacterium]
MYTLPRTIHHRAPRHVAGSIAAIAVACALLAPAHSMASSAGSNSESDRHQLFLTAGAIRAAVGYGYRIAPKTWLGASIGVGPDGYLILATDGTHYRNSGGEWNQGDRQETYAELIFADVWLSHQIQNYVAVEAGARYAAGFHSVRSEDKGTDFFGGTAAVYFGGPSLAIGTRVRFGRLQESPQDDADEFVLLWSVLHLRMAVTW